MEFSDDQDHPEMNLEYSAYIYESNCSYTDDEYIDIDFRYAGWPIGLYCVEFSDSPEHPEINLE